MEQKNVIAAAFIFCCFKLYFELNLERSTFFFFYLEGLAENYEFSAELIFSLWTAVKNKCSSDSKTNLELQ